MSKTIHTNSGYVVAVDDEDHEQLVVFKWQAFVRPHTIYIGRGASRAELRAGYPKAIYIARQITGVIHDNTVHVDHIDHDGLNNCRYNLRVCSSSQNQGNLRKHKRNTSGYKGVSWHAPSNKWRATIMFRGKQRHIGVFESAILAVEAYDQAALEQWGGYAYINFGHHGL